MNLTKAEIEKKATQSAKGLLEQAGENEPEITKDLQKIASEVSAEIVGLEHKFKSEESLTEKLADKIGANLPNLLIAGFSEDEAIKEAINLRAKQNNDALRYTFLLSAEEYIFAFKKTLNSLAKLNYKIPERRI